MNDSRFSWEGIHVIWIILGLIGAALGIGSMPPMSKKQLWTAIGAGFTCAILGPWLIPEAVAWWRNAATATPLPLPVSSALAFFFGIGGMFIVPGAIVFWTTVKSNPMAMVDWLRGKGPPPPPPPSDTTKVVP